MLAEDISTALTNAGVVGGSTGWAVQRRHMQSDPDKVVVIYETGGDAPEQRWAIDYPGFQIRVRSAADDFVGARQKLLDVFNTLHSGEVNIGGAYVFCYCIQSGPIPMGADEVRRPSFVQNYRVMKDRE